MDWNSIGLVLGGLGVGSLLTFIVQYVLENIRHRKQLVFNEKKNAYLEYITAMAESQTMSEKEGSWLRTKAMARIRLFGSKEVITVHDYFSRAAPAARKIPKMTSDTRLKSFAIPCSTSPISMSPRAKTLCARRPWFLSLFGATCSTLHFPQE